MTTMSEANDEQAALAWMERLGSQSKGNYTCNPCPPKLSPVNQSARCVRRGIVGEIGDGHSAPTLVFWSTPEGHIREHCRKLGDAVPLGLLVR